MKRRIFHLTIKATGEDKYYGSLVGIFEDETLPNLGVSKGTLDRFKFKDGPYENPLIRINKSYLLSSGEVKINNVEVKLSRRRKK